jgi:hypothetical protein
MNCVGRGFRVIMAPVYDKQYVCRPIAAAAASPVQCHELGCICCPVRHSQVRHGSMQRLEHLQGRDRQHNSSSSSSIGLEVPGPCRLQELACCHNKPPMRMTIATSVLSSDVISDEINGTLCDICK